jgi:hypothetical protein
MSLTNRSSILTLGAAKGMLDTLAQNGLAATYGYFAAHLGMHPHSTTLWGILGQVVDEDFTANGPIRSSLIVNATTLQPGTAYIERVKQHLPPNFLPDAKAEEAFWIGQLHRLGINHSNMQVLKPTY